MNTVPPDPTCIALRLEIPAIVAPPPTTSPLVTNPTFNVVRVDIPTTCKFLEKITSSTFKFLLMAASPLTYRSPPVVVIPPEGASVVTPATPSLLPPWNPQVDVVIP